MSSVQLFVFFSDSRQVICSSGRHPCLGQRFAQLEIKAILSLFLMGFEYEHVNAAGNPARVSAADIDRNNLFQARPKDDDLYIKYKKVAL